MKSIHIAALSLLLATSTPVLAASSSAGCSGSACLGIDYTALVSASASGNPAVALPGASAGTTMGGPVAGLLRHFSRKRNDK